MNDTLPATLAEALRRSRVVHDGAAIGSAIARMARELDARLNGREALFVTVLHGAMLYAGALALAMRSPLRFDTVHATRYRGATEGGALVWKQRPATPLSGRTVLLVDDILDEGHTLAALREWCRAEGAAAVLIATLCCKRHARGVPGLVSDVNGLDVPDRYVYGYGMDYREMGRNLPAIYALEDAA